MPAAPRAPGHPPAGLPIRVPAGAAAAPDDRPATFEGRVVSSGSGAGVAGADLTFSRAGAAASTRAGPDGAFTFAPPATGRWLLATVSATGFFPFAPEWGHSPVQLEARAGEHVRGLEIHLAPAVELIGEVIDPEGKPVAGATVRLLGAASEAALLPVADRSRAAPTGASPSPRRGDDAGGVQARLPPRTRQIGPRGAVVNRRVVIELGARHAALSVRAPRVRWKGARGGARRRAGRRRAGDGRRRSAAAWRG